MSPTANNFVFQNKTGQKLLLSIEPEGVLYALANDEKVSIRDEFVEKPVTLTATRGDGNEVIISIWPGDGELSVEKDGQNVLELIACGLSAD